VFLIGTCTWGCIKNIVVWRSLSGRRAESNAPVDQPIESSRDAHPGEQNQAHSVWHILKCGS
jgi:hypothetical protein